MPKMKSSKIAKKKFRVGGTGVVKHGHANTSHNTQKRGAKRRRHLRGRAVLDKTAARAVAGMLPYAGKY